MFEAIVIAIILGLFAQPSGAHQAKHKPMEYKGVTYWYYVGTRPVDRKAAAKALASARKDVMRCTPLGIVVHSDVEER